MSKYELIPGQLLYEGTIGPENLFSPQKAEEHAVLLAHQQHYFYALKNQTLSAREVRRTGFPMSPALFEREMLIAGGTIQACLYAKESGVAFNVAGGTHHAGSDWGEGFCLLNDQAIAAAYLVSEKLASQVLIIDLDVHQGNGTAEIFENNSTVFTFSMHAEKNFPFRKERSDLDIGLPNGTGDEEYLKILNDTLPGLFNSVKPDFVFYLSGVDILSTDKLGHLNISRQACKTRDEIVFSLCRKYQVPVQVSMGGGYSAQIRDIVEAHCNTFRLAMEMYF